MNGGDLTQGSIFKKLTVFAIPYLVANTIQALYGAVDMAVVGWFSSASGISAVSIGSQVIQILTSLVAGLTMGGTILIAQYFGAKREKDTVETISTMLSLFAIAAVLFTVLMLAVKDPVLRILQTPEKAFQQADEYVTISSFGVIFIFGYNALSAMLRGMGDSKSPLYFIAVACVCNVVLDLVFVGGFHMGPAGAALATVISQGLSMGLAVLFLIKKKFLFDFKISSFRIHRQKVSGLLKLGLPVSLQESMVHVSFLIIAAAVNTLGVTASAAVGICGKFDAFAMMPAGAFSAAIASMAAQNIGAGKKERAKNCMYAGILFSFICGLLFFLWAQFSPESVLGIFTKDRQVAAAGAQYLRAFSIDFMLVAFVFCMNGFFNGCGHTGFSMVNGLLSTFLVRVPLVFLLAELVNPALLGIGFAAPAASLVSVVVGFIYLRTGRWRVQKLGEG